MDMSDDEDCCSNVNSNALSTTSSVSRSFSFAKAELLTEGIFLAHSKALGQQKQEIYDLRSVMDEMTEFNDEALAVKDEEVLCTKIELGFTNEELLRMECEWEHAQRVIATKDVELTVGRKVMAYHQAQLSETKTALQVTKESLTAVCSTLMTNQAALLKKEGEIAALQKSLTTGKRTAQALAGFLTLGALCAKDS